MRHRGILIDPQRRVVEEVSTEMVFPTLYALLTLEGFRRVELLQLVRVSEVDYLAVDEEGLLLPDAPTFLTSLYPHQPLAGKALLLRGTANGNLTSTKAALERVAATVQWDDRKTTGRLTEPTIRGNVMSLGQPIFKV